MDQDSSDCVALKARLVDKVPRSHRNVTKVCIACHELESWIVADFKAVAEGFGRPELAARAAAKPHENTDEKIRHPLLEISKAVPSYQKIDGARRVGPHLNPSRNASKSFVAFCAAVKLLANTQ